MIVYKLYDKEKKAQKKFSYYIQVFIIYMKWLQSDGSCSYFYEKKKRKQKPTTFLGFWFFSSSNFEKIVLSFFFIERN